MAAITVEHLTKRFGTFRAVDDLSFEVGEGSISGFLGRNGAGKTTTMRAVLGLARPTSGRALIHGRPITELAHPATVVGAAIDYGVHPGRTARSILEAQAIAGGISGERVGQMLDLVGLGAAGDRRAGGFSTGMKQRLALAGALLGDPEVLLLDEPTNGLDPDGVVWLRALLADLRREGRTILVSSHVMTEVAQIADEIVIIEKGRLIRHSAMADLSGPESIRVRTADLTKLAKAMTRRKITFELLDDGLETRGASQEEVGRAVTESGAVVYEMRPVERSLEDLFFALTATPETSDQ